MIKMKVSLDKHYTRKVTIEGFNQTIISAPNPEMAKYGITHPEGGQYSVPGSFELIVTALAS